MREELFYKYFTGNLTDAEKESLFRQVDNDVALKDELAGMQNVVTLCRLAEKEGDKEWASAKKKELARTLYRRKVRRISLQVARYAAILLLVAGAWFLSRERTLDHFSEEYTWVEAPRGQRVCITLADGTSVWLSPCTKLKVPNVFDKRRRVVELEGEGFFKVAGNPYAPFTVKTKRYSVKVLGTEFNVFAYPHSSEFEAELVKGSVYVYDKEHEQKGVRLLPNEKATLINGRLQKSSSRYMQYQSVKDGIFVFGDKPFGELLKRLELWYDVRFIVRRPAILQEIYSGKFRQSDEIGDILQAIKEVGKFDYRILSEKEIEIY